MTASRARPGPASSAVLPTELAPCPICAGRDFRVEIPRVPDFFFGTGSPADISRCLGCGLVQTRPRLSAEALKIFYDEGYTDFLEHHDPGGRWADWQNDYRLTLIRKVHRLAAHDHILDVGCDQGRFVRRAAEACHCRATGLDVNTAALSRGVQVPGVDYVQGTLGDSALEAGSFSLITMYQVLEHVPDPVDFLRCAHDLLPEHGLLVVEVPDFGEPWRRVFGRYWASLFVPQHLSHFEASSLERVVREAGFQQILYHKPMFVPVSFVISLGILLDKRLGVDLEGVSWKLLMAASWFLVDVPTALLLRIFHRTWAQVIIARKGPPGDGEPGVSNGEP